MRSLVHTASDEFIYPRDWSPDGAKIVAVRYKWHPSSGFDNASLIWLNAADASLQTIVTAPATQGISARVSPDGRYIAYGPAHVRNGVREVHLIAINGSNETTLSAHPAGEYPVAWSPDGKYVLFISTRTVTRGLWAIPVADGKPQGQPFLIQRDLGPGAESNGITRSGILAHSVHSTISDTYTASMNAATGKVTSAPIPLPLARTGSNWTPQWSPDGDRILVAWAQNAQGRRFVELSVYSFATGKEQPINPRTEMRGAGGGCWLDRESILTSAGRDVGIVRIKSRDRRNQCFRGTHREQRARCQLCGGRQAGGCDGF